MNQPSRLARAFAGHENDGAVVECAALAALLAVVSIGAVSDALIAPDNLSRLISHAVECARPTLSTATTLAFGLFSLVLGTVFRLISAAVEFAMPALATATALILDFFSIVFGNVLEYASRILSTASTFALDLFSLAR